MYNKVSQGQRVSGYPVDVFNSTVGLIKKDRLDGVSRRSNTGPESVEIYVKNMTGTDVGQYEVLALGKSVIAGHQNPDEFDSHIVLEGNHPLTDLSVSFGVTQTPLRNEEIGKAIISGVTHVQMRMNNVSHKFATLRKNSFQSLESAGYGPVRILAPGSGGALRRAVVNITYTPESAAFFLTPAGGIPAATGKYTPHFGSCRRCRFTASNSIDPVYPVEYEDVWNFIEEPVAENIVIQAKRIDGAWFVDVEPCPED